MDDGNNGLMMEMMMEINGNNDGNKAYKTKMKNLQLNVYDLVYPGYNDGIWIRRKYQYIQTVTIFCKFGS